MKKISFTKRALSIMLCAVMLVSCWVFTAPSANAAVTGPSSTYGDTTPGTSAPSASLYGRYRVRLCIHEDNSFDKSIHDNATYTAGITYGLNNSQRNLTGTSTSDDNGNYWCEYAKISYKSTNGTGTEGAVWFNMGDKDDHGRGDIVSGWGQDYGYFPADDGVLIDGFPTSLTVRYFEKAKGSGGYTVYLQVAVWNSSTSSWTWSEGTDTSTGTFGIGGWNSQYAGGILTASTGDVSTVASGTEIKLNNIAVPNASFPVAQSTPTVSYGSATVTAPSTSSASAVTNALSFTPPKDQYGAYMATSITTSCSNKATGITQSGKTTSVGYTANIAGDTDSQTVTATVKWPQKVTTTQKSKTASFTINDAQYQVTFKNEDGTGNNLYQDNFSYGHTPEYNGTTPTKTDTANPPVYSYTHDGWSSTANGTKLTSLPAVTGTSNKTFYAHFSQSLIDYTVKFVNNENTEISSAEYHIGDTLTEPESAQIPDTYESVDKVYTFTGWVGTNGEVYDGTCHGAITYKPVYSDVPRQYTVTFQEEDGTVIKSQKLNYNTVPSSVTGLVPALIDKDPDDTNHYTPAWSQSVDTGITGDTVFRIVYTATPHTWVSDAGVVTQEGTCSEKSIVTKTCSVCNHDVEMEGDYDSTNHNMQTIKADPKDGMDIGDAFVCRQCSWCGKYWAAKYNGTDYDAITVDPDTHEAIMGANEASQVKDSSEKVPSPYFNNYSDDTIQDEYGDPYQYGNRGSGLKLMKNVGEFNAATTKQDFRFSGSVAIPKGVSYEIGSRNDNVIKDFGFVYSQDSHIWNDDEGKADTDQLVLDSGDNKIATMSVVNNNAANGNVISVNDSTGRLNGENGEWSGVTFHPGDGSDEFPDSLTFNLVISIKATNWKMQYAARPYITYTYHGETYTVYDTGASAQGGQVLRPEYSCCSVYSLASYIAVWNPDNPAAKYCTDNILAHEALLYPTSFTADKKSDEFTDWWKWIEGDTSWSDFINPNRVGSFYSDYNSFMNP